MAQNAQCGNFGIFVSLIFYVKSILENLEVPKLPFWALDNTVNLVKISLQKLQKFIKSKFCATECVELTVLGPPKSLK